MLFPFKALKALSDAKKIHAFPMRFTEKPNCDEISSLPFFGKTRGLKAGPLNRVFSVFFAQIRPFHALVIQ